MIASALAGSASGLIAAAKALGEGLATLEADIDKVMSQPGTSPAKRQEAAAALDALKASSANFINACKAAIADPKNPALIQKIKEAKNDFDNKLENVLHIVKTRKGEGESQPLPQKVEHIRSTEDIELVIIAKEQVTIAQQMIQEATALASKETNPAKKQAILSAIQNAKTAADEVTSSANRVSENPTDSKALKSLDEAQMKLATNVTKLAQVTKDNSTELADAMQQMQITDKLSSDDLTHLALETIKLIAEFMNDSGDARSTIDRAKEISLKTNQLAALLRDKSSKTVDPLYKEQLLNFSKIMRDKSMQVKILSAVQIASQKSDDSQQVASCTQGLAGSIKETLNILQEQSLKERVKTALGRVKAIRNLFNIWRKGK